MNIITISQMRKMKHRELINVLGGVKPGLTPAHFACGRAPYGLLRFPSFPGLLIEHKPRAS